MSDRMRCIGVILAGGRASRLGGRPKGVEVVGGARIVDRVARALRACTESLLLIANTPNAAAWLPGERVASDIVPGHGGLSGVHAALVHAATPVLVVAWDMPFVSADLLSALRELGEATTDAEAAAPVSLVDDGGSMKREPLCAWYSPRALRVIERRLAEGDRRLMDLLGELQTQTMPYSEVARFGDPRQLFLNVNTEEELQEARELAARTPSK